MLRSRVSAIEAAVLAKEDDEPEVVKERRQLQQAKEEVSRARPGATSPPLVAARGEEAAFVPRPRSRHQAEPHDPNPSPQLAPFPPPQLRGKTDATAARSAELERWAEELRSVEAENATKADEATARLREAHAVAKEASATMEGATDVQKHAEEEFRRAKAESAAAEAERRQVEASVALLVRAQVAEEVDRVTVEARGEAESLRSRLEAAEEAARVARADLELELGRRVIAKGGRGGLAAADAESSAAVGGGVRAVAGGLARDAVSAAVAAAASARAEA